MCARGQPQRLGAGMSLQEKYVRKGITTKAWSQYVVTGGAGAQVIWSGYETTGSVSEGRSRGMRLCAPIFVSAVLVSLPAIPPRQDWRTRQLPRNSRATGQDCGAVAPQSPRDRAGKAEQLLRCPAHARQSASSKKGQGGGRLSRPYPPPISGTAIPSLLSRSNAGNVKVK